MKYIVSILILVAVGVGLYFHTGTDFALLNARPKSFAKKIYCDKALLAEHGVDADHLPALDQALNRHAKDVQQADMYVDKTHRKAGAFEQKPSARFQISLELHNGCKLQSRFVESAWDQLDNAMASAVDRCMSEYDKLRAQGASLGGKSLINL